MIKQSETVTGRAVCNMQFVEQHGNAAIRLRNAVTPSATAKLLVADFKKIEKAVLLRAWQGCRWDLPAVNHGCYRLQGTPPDKEITQSKWDKEEPPNYPQDLNAVHELEVKLDGEACLTYDHLLWSFAAESMPHVYPWKCTARQRCIAYIMTKEGAE